MMSLCTMLLRMIGYGILNALIVIKQCLLRSVIKKLLKKYIKIWKKLVVWYKKIYSEPLYGDNDKYIKTKLKLYGGNLNTNFRGKKITK